MNNPMTIGSFEAKTKFSALLKLVAQGEHIFITKHGQLIAKLSPINGPDQQKIHAAIEKIKVFRAQQIPGIMADWKNLRDEGRR